MPWYAICDSELTTQHVVTETDIPRKARKSTAAPCGNSTGACAASTPIESAKAIHSAASRTVSKGRDVLLAVVDVSCSASLPFHKKEDITDYFLIVNCGADAAGYVHGGVNVGLGCTGDRVKRCIDQNLGISGNSDYVCNITG